jgi:hypothetical protein
MPTQIGSSTYYDFKELRKLAREMARGGAPSKYSPQLEKGKLVHYHLRINSDKTSVVAHVELASGFTVERSMLL